MLLEPHLTTTADDDLEDGVVLRFCANPYVLTESSHSKVSSVKPVCLHQSHGEQQRHHNCSFRQRDVHAIDRVEKVRSESISLWKLLSLRARQPLSLGSPAFPSRFSSSQHQHHVSIEAHSSKHQFPTKSIVKSFYPHIHNQNIHAQSFLGRNRSPSLSIRYRHHPCPPASQSGRTRNSSL